MKKLRLFAVAAFAAMFTTSYAQTVVDLGTDWDGSALVSSLSKASFAAGVNTYTLNSDLDTQVSFSLISGSSTSNIPTADKKSVYASSTSASIARVDIKSDQTDYFQVDATITKKITKIKVNGTSGSLTDKSSSAIVYSSGTPFDETKITGYDALSLAICRAGDQGSTYTATIPGDTKSFRIYRGVKLTQSGGTYVLDAISGTLVGGSQVTRVAYVSVTIEDAGQITTPSIGLASGSNAQTVYPNQSIKDIVYKWGGTATSASVTWNPSIPDGITVATDPASKSLTISGAPRE